MIDIHAAVETMGLKSKMLIQVHDELVFDVPRDEVERMGSMVKGKDGRGVDTPRASAGGDRNGR